MLAFPRRAWEREGASFMRARFVICCFAAVVLLAAGSSGQRPTGLGDQSCLSYSEFADRWQKEKHDTFAAQVGYGHLEWCFGFIDGLNYGKEKPVDTGKMVVRWLDGYCLQNPGKKWVDACKAFYDEAAKRMKSKP